MRSSTQIFFLLSVIIACTDIAFVWINFQASENALDDSIHQVSRSIRASFQQALLSTEERMLQLSTYIAADTTIQQLFLAGKRAVESEGGDGGGPKAAEIRAKLNALLAPSRDALAATSDFRQLHFHLAPDALSFLRVHAVHKFGDRLDTVRHTIVATNRSQKPVSGFETGRVYSGIRGVVPVFADDGQTGTQYIGALESGTSFESTLQAVAMQHKVNMAVLLSMNHLKSNVWPDYLESYLLDNPFIHGFAVETSTSPLITKIRQNNPFVLNANNEYSRIQYIDNIPYCVNAFALRDFIGQSKPERPHVGVVVSWRNVSDALAAFHNSLKTNILFGALGFILIESILYLAIRSSSRKLEKIVEQGRSDLQRSMEKLQESEVKFRTVADFSYDWEEWILPDNSYAYISPACKRITGYSRNDFLENPHLFVESVHPDDKDMFVSHTRKHLDQEYEKSEMYFRILTRDGVLRWIWHQCQPVFSEDGTWIGRRTSNRDITRQKQIEQAIYENQWKYSSIINNTSEGFWMISPDKITIEVNNALCELLGYSREEILGKKPFDFVDKKNQQIFLAQTEAMSSSEHQVYDIELRRRDQSNVSVLFSATTLLSEDGELLGSFAFISDLTDHKKIEQSLRQAKEEAESARHATSVFLANMSHELRTPLNAILGYSQILAKDASLTAKQRDGIIVIHRSGDHLLTMLNDVLDLSKIEADKLDLLPVEFLLLPFLQTIVDIISIQAKQKGLTFSFHSASNLPHIIYADELRLRQVLLNLLGNAVKFTNKGTISLQVEAMADEPLDQEGHYRTIRFCVDDSGIGITADQQKNIFAPFHQEGDRLMKVAGTGLGLTISQELVAKMGGELKVISPLYDSPAPGAGSRFCFSIEVMEIAATGLTKEPLPQKEITISSTLDREEQINLPPVKDLQQLLQQAMKGDVSAIEEHIDRLTLADSRYLPFTKKITELSTDFRLDAIEDYIRQSLEESQP